tara:strand:- start:57 stop:587 length:531 start_codon:yes stop_codon:yes gene_type:complete
LHRTAFAPPNVPCTFLGLTVLCHFEPQLVWRVIVCTLVLIIGITTSIGLCAALYDLAKSLSDRDSILPDERGDDLFVPTILCKIMTTVSFIVVLLACATSARVLLAAEAERVLLQKLLETKSTRAWPSQWHQPRCARSGKAAASKSTGLVQWSRAPRSTTCSGASSRSRSGRAGAR